MLDGEGQPAPDTGDTPSGEAKTTPTGDEAVLAELEEQLKTEETEGAAGDGENAEGQSEDDELEDFEDGGKKAKLPKWVKARVMQQADYTRKTMEVAEHRKAVEAERAEIKAEQEFNRENVREVAKLVNLEDQLATYEKIDWDKLFQENKDQHQYHMNRFQMLERQRNSLAGELQHKHQQRALKAQQDTAKRLEASLARVAKEIPTWSNELAGKLTEYAEKLGYSTEELEEHRFYPHRVVTIHKAHLFDQLMARTRAKAKQPEQQQIQPVATIGSRRSAPSALPSDKDDIETWVRKEKLRMQKVSGARA